MTCEHDWTIRFPDVGFEVRPTTMNLKLSRDKYDYCRAKLPAKVGQEMKPHTRYADGLLAGLSRVEVLYNGEVVQPFFFRPDFVDYGTTSTHLELHDLQKSLYDGTVDIQYTATDLHQIYQVVLNKTNHRLIDTVRFTVPDSGTRTIYGEMYEYEKGLMGQEDKIDKQLAKEDTKVVESYNAVDFDQITVEEAITKLNKKFGLTSWVNRDGELVVGLPEANSVSHIAAPDDRRAWRYKDAQISHGREPIKKVVVKGVWENPKNNKFEGAGWFDDDDGKTDAISYGYAERTDIDYGTTKTIDSSSAGADSIDTVARLALKSAMREQNHGSVDIDPQLSGTDISNVIDLTTGDIIHLVPNDDYFDNPSADSGVIGDPPDTENICSAEGFVNNEAYVTQEVTHDISEDGDWNINAELGMYGDVPIETWKSYYDPMRDKTYKEEPTNKDIKIGWVEFDVPDVTVDVPDFNL